MKLRLSLILATLSASAFGQAYYQVGYAANLNIGDSVVNISNSGAQGGFFGATPPTVGNICVNTYVFDPQEEEIGCCACLVTPNGLNSLSAKSDLISNNLTPAVPTSIVIKLIASQPGPDITGAFNVCNPATVGIEHGVVPIFGAIATVPYTPDGQFPAGTPFPGVVNTGSLAAGLLAWGTTLEPNVTPGSYSVVGVPFIPSTLSGAGLGITATVTTGLASGTPASIVGTELSAVASLCNFIQANGTGFGICRSCRLGALGGAKQ